MKIAAIYDIHGNAHALEAVLKEIEKEQVDKVIVGGDLAWGPQPKRVIEQLYKKRNDFIFIMGNSDREIFEQYKKPQKVNNDMVSEINQWCIEELTKNQLEWLGSFKFAHSEGDILFVHGSPRHDIESIRIDTPENEVYEMVKNAHESVIVCGHTHIQFQRQIFSKVVINAGSVGLQSRAKGACWLLMDSNHYSLRVTKYDFAGAAADIILDGAPFKEEFANHVKNPPYEGP